MQINYLLLNQLLFYQFDKQIIFYLTILII